MNISRRATRSLVACLFLLFFFAPAATRSWGADLIAVDLIGVAPESSRMMLEIQGQFNGVQTMRLDGGRFVFDLASVAWNGPLRRVNPEATGVREYRYSQLSYEPLVTRFVVEVKPGWECRHERAAGGLLVACGGSPILPTTKSETGGGMIAVVRSIGLSSPVAGLDAGDLIRRSLEFVPRDLVKDGLPNFGAVRDDWLGAPRNHLGLDIYGDELVVQAAAGGTVVGTGIGELAGGWAKISHSNGVETVYVHISRLNVQTGEDVARGQPIAMIRGPVGNAVEPQLHFEVRLDGTSVDPVPLIYELASEDLKLRITRANEHLAVLAQERAARVQRETN